MMNKPEKKIFVEFCEDRNSPWWAFYRIRRTGWKRETHSTW